MCGICGIFEQNGTKQDSEKIVKKMTAKLSHRGPDSVGHYSQGNITYGFTRLSIIDLEGGMQPISNEDGSLVMVCNGEIFNYIELRKELEQRGHRFKTQTDVEVILHLYEEKGSEFLNDLNGQFAFALFDTRKRKMFCARDHFGIIPFFYTVAGNSFIFASEIKAILEHPKVKKELDLVGLDQVLSFPGLIGDRTMFKNIKSLENGHYLEVRDGANITDVEYWDVHYPRIGEIEYKASEDYYSQRLKELITRAVKIRLRADVPVGFYISGGLDSSLISALATQLTPEVKRYSFSIDFEEKDKSESEYQRKMARYINSSHSEKMFLQADISKRLKKAIYHSEYPLKETYNTASLALSESARQKNIKVVLSGEGADEWFAGYPGYKFDQFKRFKKKTVTPETPFENEINKKIWGDENFSFEMNQYAFRKVKKELYSGNINRVFDEQVDSLNREIVNIDRLQGRDVIHKRSYLDYKLRLVSHLIADHGDRMAYANSVEGRYPFLDKDLVDFVVTIPPTLKLKEFQEKYILKKAAKGVVPNEILDREKFAFHAPGSPYLLQKKIDYIEDLLSYETIKKQGYFNPDT
ncbi:MAG: asparagine synthase (glutamine-hydrolyzing), partial [bacterium]|nr:asparagine synthase (glutamine-hydrolyzing) [bacterium]